MARKQPTPKNRPTPKPKRLRKRLQKAELKLARAEARRDRAEARVVALAIIADEVRARIVSAEEPSHTRAAPTDPIAVEAAAMSGMRGSDAE